MTRHLIACVVLLAGCSASVTPTDGGMPDAVMTEQDSRVDPSPRIIDLALSQDAACVIDADGGVRCWGRNPSDRMFSDGRRLLDIRTIPLPEPAAQLQVAGAWTMCARTRSGRLYCWGDDSYGQAGVGCCMYNRSNRDFPCARTPTLVPVMERIAPLSPSIAQHVCVRTEGGAVYCWGNSGSAQVGYPYDNTYPCTSWRAWPTPHRVQLAGAAIDVVALADNTCALLEDGTVHCWGSNEVGQLGLPVGPFEIPYCTESRCAFAWTPVRRAQPARATRLFGTHGGFFALQEDGSLLFWSARAGGLIRGLGPEVPTNGRVSRLTFETAVTAVFLGSSGSCARTVDGATWCWGTDPLALTEADWTRWPAGSPPQRVSGLDRFSKVALSGWAGCGIDSEGALWCWGDGRGGLLPGTGNVIVPPYRVQFPR
jgi:alpha-tubulin suppressor-like RCC1 family protein